MTRARNDLVVGFHERERAWMSTRGPQEWTANGTSTRWLDGNPKNLILNASGESEQMRDYLRQKVAIGDSVELRPQRATYSIWHCGNRIGVTSRWVGPPANPSAVEANCQVVGLYKFEPRDEWLARLLEKDAGYPGWHYVPLIQGRLMR